MKLWIPILLVMIGAAPTLAGPHDQARFALNVQPPFTPTKTMGLCGPDSYDPNAWDIPCSQYTVSRDSLREWPGPVIYLVVGQLGSVGILGASCGIDYTGGPGTGIDPQWVTWTGCSDGLEYYFPGPNGDWPNPGSGLRMTWLTCQNQDNPPDGAHAVLGAFSIYVYSEALLRVTPNNNVEPGPELAVTSCGGGTTNLLDIVPPENQDLVTATAQFGGYDQAWNPCGEWPWPWLDTQKTTWGRIKQQYGP